MRHKLIHLDIEVATGATLVILEATRVAVFPNDTLHPSDLILTMYTDKHMKMTQVYWAEIAEIHSHELGSDSCSMFS